MNKAKRVTLNIFGVIFTIIAIGFFLIAVLGLIGSFLNIPPELVHDDANYHKGRVVEVSFEGYDGGLNLQEVYFKVVDENGVTHKTSVLAEQNLNVLERNRFIFEYEGKEIECVFSNYGEGYEEDKYIVAVSTEDKEYLNYEVGKLYLATELLDNSSLYAGIIFFGVISIIALLIAIKLFRKAKSDKKEKTENKAQKRPRGSKLLAFFSGYMITWGTFVGVLVIIFAISGMFQVDVNNVAKEELCYQCAISEIEISERDGINSYRFLINEDEKVLFRSVENEELAVDNGVIKDYLNGKEILCIYTYVEDNNDADIVALFSEDSVYLDRDTSIVNLKEYYVKTNASAKIVILMFGISSPIFIITGIVLVFANKKMKNKVEQKAEPVVDYMRYAK